VTPATALGGVAEGEDGFPAFEPTVELGGVVGGTVAMAPLGADLVPLTFDEITALWRTGR